MPLDYTIIGQRLKKARKAKKMTQDELSEKLDVSIAFLSRIERGTSEVNLKRLAEIARYLDVTMEYLIRRKKYIQVMKLIYISGCKYMGYLLGKKYKKLPRKFVIWCSMNREYWR